MGGKCLAGVRTGAVRGGAGCPPGNDATPSVIERTGPAGRSLEPDRWAVFASRSEFNRKGDGSPMAMGAWIEFGDRRWV